MKKLLSFLTVCTMVLTSMPVMKTNAEDTENVDLYALAQSLGADTDYFTFPNYVRNEADNQSYYESMIRCNTIEASRGAERYYRAVLSSGRCMGISVLEILNHNGIISPSDIQEGAEVLTDIDYNDALDYYIAFYQAYQNYIEFDLYMHWFVCKLSEKEKADVLIEKAQNSMKQGKYFLITYNSVDLSHAVVGIGITDGEWEFDGEKYDKCILTLDSNAVNQDMKALGFTEKTSLYINSETGKAYSPFYFEKGNGEGFTYSVIDDDSLLNYRGLINPSENINTDVSIINKLQIDCDTDYDIIVTNPDGSIYDGIAESANNFDELFWKTYVLDGKKFQIENHGGNKLSTYFTDSNRVVMIDATSDDYECIKNTYKDDDRFSLTSNGGLVNYEISLFMNEENYDFSPHYRLDMLGETDSDITVETTEQGYILSGENGIKTKIFLTDLKMNDDGSINTLKAREQKDSIIVKDTVLLSFDEKGNLKYFIGENYDTEVQKGDVNCDGFIDASDASIVLKYYAASSTNTTGYVSKILGDYNDDGYVDACDASMILAKYSELSTS